MTSPVEFRWQSLFVGFWTFAGQFGILGGFMDFCWAVWTSGRLYGLLQSGLDFWEALWTFAKRFGLLGGLLDFSSFGRGKLLFWACFVALNAFDQSIIT